MKSIGTLLVVAACGVGFVVGHAAGDASAVLTADRAFNQSVADKDVEHFRALVAEDAMFGGGTAHQTQGREAIVKAWAPFFEPDAVPLTWAPVKGEVLSGGEIGYTVGRYVHGRARGQYLTVWRKQADGRWRAIYDIGT